MKYLTSLVFAIFLVACSDSGVVSNSPTGTLSINITDAPVDNADAVFIHFTDATIQPANGDRIDVVITDPDDDQVIGRSIDLLKLTGEKSTVLFEQTLPAGQYSWIRLNVDFNPLKTFIQIDGETYPLNCASCADSGLKLNRNFDVDADNTMAFTLDFDLGKSITEANGNYKLRPTIRIIETAAAGNISGTVDGTLISLIDMPDNTEDCVVYIYEGSNVIPDDTYIPDTVSASIPPDYNNPLLTTPVELNNTSVYEYTAAYLPEGSYTVSLTCDAENDNPLEINDADVSFTGTTNATVTAGTTFTVDFSIP